jgi:2-polyprenyl-3-methyl-5-hydroxy-6-metoxy-1,4-benzoquinol methylase
MAQFLTDRPQAFRDFIYRNYGETHHVYANAAVADSPGRREQITAALRKWLPQDRSARILDFGCGDGALLAVAESLGYTRLCGVDAVRTLAEAASRRTTADVMCADGLAYLREAAAESFEAIVAFDVLEHLTRDELVAWVTEVERLLTPGGGVILHVPNGGSPFVGGVLWGDLTHEQAFTPHSLGQLFHAAGFLDGVAYEDQPIARGAKSWLRAQLWKALRAAALAWLAVETGVVRGRVLTINLFYTARKAGAARRGPGV